MIVEFKSIRNSQEESFNRDKTAHISGISSLQFIREDDYIDVTIIDMTKVEDYSSDIYPFNNKEIRCTTARLKGNVFTEPLIISPEDFQIIFEKAKGIKVKKAEDIIKNETNTKSTKT